jgi:hypothetical protein
MKGWGGEELEREREREREMDKTETFIRSWGFSRVNGTVSRKKSYYRFERERQRERVREVYVFLHSFIRRIATSCFRCKRLKPKKRERFLSG